MNDDDIKPIETVADFELCEGITSHSFQSLPPVSMGFISSLFIDYPKNCFDLKIQFCNFPVLPLKSIINEDCPGATLLPLRISK